MDAHLLGVNGGTERPAITSDLPTLCKDGRLDKVLVALRLLHEHGSHLPSVHHYKHLLQACSKKKALAEARWVQAHLVRHGLLECDTVLGDLVVSTLVNCGGLGDGLDLFYSLSRRSVFSWTAIISGYSDAGLCKEALGCYERMQLDKVQPNKYTFVSLLKACSRLRDLEEAKRIHAAAVAHGFGADVFVGSSLVSMYAKCGSIVDAQHVFDTLSERDGVSWNAMLSAYARHNEGEKALQIYWRMQEEGVRQDAWTFVSALQACGNIAEKEKPTVLADGQNVKREALWQGKEIHAAVAVRGLESDIYVGNALVTMYAKCGSIWPAEQVFFTLSKPDVVSWTAMISAYAQLDQAEKALHMYRKMQVEEGVRPNGHTFVSVLQACSTLAEKEEGVLFDGQNVKVESLQKGKEIHAAAICQSFESDVFVANSLVSMYAKCGNILDAKHVFDSLSQRDVVSWTAMVAAYAQQNQGERALQLYQQMQTEGLKPDARTFVSAVQACGSLADVEKSVDVDGQHILVESLQKGKEVHAGAAAGRSGFEADVFVGNNLLSMYAKCGSIGDAQQVFGTLPHRDVVSWNVMLAAYTQHDQGEKALQVFWQMQEEGVRPNARTFVSAVQACCTLAEKERSVLVEGQNVKARSLLKGREVHVVVSRHGLETDVYVGSTLVGLYARCGSIKDAEQVFSNLPQGNVVPWTALMAAYSQLQQGDKALQLYSQMEAQGVQGDEATFRCVLELCSRRGALDMCMKAHKSITENGLLCSPSVACSLIHAYSNCGSMVDAQRVFDSLPQPDVASWTALIAGYARSGCFQLSMKLFEDMRVAGVEPDGVTFLALLSACSHAGMVEKGLEYFSKMTRDHSIPAELEHYACVIDLVGRAGLFDEAECLLSQMPMQPDLSVWLCLLSACRKHGNVVLGRRAFDGAVALEPQQAAPYLLMANIYAQASMWDNANEVDGLKDNLGAWKLPGQSWIEHEQEVHTFLVGDHRHQYLTDINGLLRELSAHLNEEESDC